MLERRVLDSLHLAREEVSCYYKYITWVDDDTYRFEEEVLMTGDEEVLSSDHVSLHARCVTSDGTNIYTNILIYIPDLTSTATGQEDKETYSVVVLGMDGLSQLNMIRSDLNLSLFSPHQSSFSELCPRPGGCSGAMEPSSTKVTTGSTSEPIPTSWLSSPGRTRTSASSSRT